MNRETRPVGSWGLGAILPESSVLLISESLHPEVYRGVTFGLAQGGR